MDLNKTITKYQIYNSSGDPVLEPFLIKSSAEYMIKAYMKDCLLIEIEVEGE